MHIDNGVANHVPPRLFLTTAVLKTNSLKTAFSAELVCMDIQFRVPKVRESSFLDELM